MQKENVVNLNDEKRKILEDKQAETLKQIKAAGFLNPLAKEGGIFKYTDFSGNIFYRYIENFKWLDPNRINPQQVGVQPTDDLHYREVVVPSLERQPLQNPVIVSYKKNANTPDMEVGHHRQRYYKEIGKNKIPAIVITGEWFNWDNKQAAKDLSLISRTKSNPQTRHRPLSRADIAYLCQESIKTNPTQDGRWLKGGFPPKVQDAINGEFSFREMLDRICGPEVAGSQQAQTSIHGLLETKTTQIIPVTEESKMKVLKQNKMNLGEVETNKPRIPFPLRFDEKNNSLVWEVDDHGSWQLWAYIGGFMEKYYADSDYKKIFDAKNIKYIDVLSWTRNLDGTLLNKLKQENAQVKQFSKFNDLFRNMPNFPVMIRKVVFPKQLKDPADKERTILLLKK